MPNVKKKKKTGKEKPQNSKKKKTLIPVLNYNVAGFIQHFIMLFCDILRHQIHLYTRSLSSALKVLTPPLHQHLRPH